MEKSLWIVIADDDDDDQLLVKQAIAELNVDCRVTSVYNGFELLDLLQTASGNKAGITEKPHFILLDLNMPKLDGFSVLKKIKQDSEMMAIPIYILSTSRMDEDKQRSGVLGASGFYTKPILYEQLKQIVGDIFRRAST